MESRESNTMSDEDSFDQNRLDRSVAKMVIVDEMQFSCVEGEGFRNLVTWAQPRYKVPDRMKIEALLWDLYLSEKAKIASLMGGQRVGSHHSRQEFAVRGNVPKDEVQIYTWWDATLREWTDLDIDWKSNAGTTKNKVYAASNI